MGKYGKRGGTAAKPATRRLILARITKSLFFHTRAKWGLLI